MVKQTMFATDHLVSREQGMTQGWSPFGVRGVFVVQEAALENSVNYEDEVARVWS